MTSPPILRCSTATNTSSAVVGLLQASHSNLYHHGIWRRTHALDNPGARTQLVV